MDAIEVNIDNLQRSKKSSKLNSFVNEENFLTTHGKAHSDFCCPVCMQLPLDSLKKCKSCESFICMPCHEKIVKS